MRRWARPTSGGPEGSATGLTRDQRRLLVGSGLVFGPLRPQLTFLAKKRRNEIFEMIKGRWVVLWSDNLNKRRYSRNPGENRNQNISGTVYALLPLPALPNRPAFPGYPELFDLSKSAKENLPNAVRNWQLQWKNNLITFRILGLTFDNIRVPRDIHRYGVKMAKWQPSADPRI